jgi:hypothetical protein
MKIPMSLGVFFTTFLMIQLSGQAATLHVPSQYPTIQSAIDAASSGDAIQVAPGTYVENVDFKGKAVTVESTDGPGSTILDGGQPVDPDYGSVVLFQGDETWDSVLRGFTLTNGTGTYHEFTPLDYDGYMGGAVFCNDASPHITGNIIEENTASFGGAIACIHSGALPLLEHNVILDNHGVFGGGIACVSDADAVISNNRIEGNEAFDTGGGLYFWFASPSVNGNFITGNAVTFGGGAACIDASPVMANNVFLANQAEYGGGVYCGFDSSPRIVNSTFHDNLSDHGAALCSWSSSPSAENSIFYNGEGSEGPEILIGTTSYPSTFTVSHCNVKGGQASLEVEPGCTLNWGYGMIDSDPLFVDAAGGDFHLAFNSPCRGSGNNSASSLPEVDFEGDPRIVQGTVDMGADEFHTHLYYTGDATPGGIVEGKIIGLPGTFPVALAFGSGIMDPPLTTPWGNFFLASPWTIVLLGSLPSSGFMVLPAALPATPPGPYDLPMQALVGDTLTNLSVLEVR